MLLNRQITSFIMVAMFLLTGLLRANSPAAEYGKEYATEEAVSLVKIATLRTVEANAEFQSNVRLLQSQRQRVVDLQLALEKATTSAEKEAIQEEMDKVLKQLNENNLKMTEIYGFSLNRNYTMVLDKVHVYVSITPEEAAEIKAAQAAKD